MPRKVHVLLWLLVAACVCVSLASLYLGLDAHYDVRCLRFGFADAALNIDGVTCRDETGLEVWLRDLQNTNYGIGEGAEL